MKNYIKSIALTAIAALAFAGCAKEVANTASEEFTHTAQVVLSKNEFRPQTESKTAVVEGQSEASYIWIDGDASRLHVYENGTEGEITNMALSDGGATATLTVSFTGTPTAPYTYTAMYATDISSAGNPLIPASQSPTTSSFDPAADILVAKPITSETETLTSLSFTMGRVVTVNKMTLTGLVAGEKISKVEFELDQYLSSRYTKDKDTGEWSFTGNNKKLTLNYNDAEVPSGGTFPVYFVAAPVTAAGIVGIVVTTDQNVYTKTHSLDPNPFAGKSLSLAVGTFMRFNMGLDGYGEAISSAVNYQLVVNQADLISGASYLIVADNTNLFAMSTQGSNNRSGVEVTAANNIISIDNTIAASIFEIVSVGSGQYTIKDITPNSDTENKYLYDASTSSKNYLRSTDSDNDDTAKWTIEISSGVASILNVGYTDKPVMCFNSQNSIFACYASLSSYKTLSLYVDQSSCKTPLATPSILAEANGSDIEVTWSDVANATSYLVTCTGQASQTINSGVEYAKFENLSDGVYEVTVTAKTSNDGYVDSVPAVESDIVVGTPSLAAPTNVSISQTETGISASWTASENATNYDWALYSDSGLNTLVSSGNVSATTLAKDIALTGGTTYYFTVIAKATGYTASPASSAASFTAESLVSKTFTAADYNAAGSLSLSKGSITGAFAQGNGTTAPAVSNDRVRLYQQNADPHKGGTLTITSTSANIKRVVFTFDGSNNYLTSDVGSYSSGTWTTTTAVSSVVFYCNGTSSSQRADVASFTVYYVSSGPELDKLNMGEITCDDNGENENSLTFSWSAVGNASGYQVSTDGGSTFGSTQTALTYTLTGLSAGTSHTIWVKAIGDGVNYSDSDARESASGTTKLASTNDGSLEHPYTASEAATLALSGDTGSYYITGTISSIPSQYGTNQYGNANFWIDDGVFEGYKINYFNDVKWVEGDEVLAVDDVVVFHGTLTVYNSTTPETSSGYLVSINGKSSLTLPELTITKNDANKQITVAWTAVTGASSVSYVVSCGGETYNASAAGSHTFTMSAYDILYTISVTASASGVYSSTSTSSATLVDPSAGVHYYEKVTDLSTLSANDKILIINTNHDALPAFTGTSTVSPTDLHTSKYDSSNDRFPTNDATVDNCAITLVAPTTAVNGKVVFKLKMSNNYYIVKTATSGTGFNPNTSSTAVSGDWTLTIESNGKVKIKHNLSNATRCILWQAGSVNKFGAYAESNFTGSGYSGVDLYKLN